jgi:hypothetical protein
MSTPVSLVSRSFDGVLPASVSSTLYVPHRHPAIVLHVAGPGGTEHHHQQLAYHANYGAAYVRERLGEQKLTEISI